ncbi:MAG TPA: chorismate mutase [Rhodothermales bacterium]|nr:chorismate mutase [Rhodothermales bacterium]
MNDPLARDMLAAARAALDGVDTEILRLLARRAELALQIGAAKRQAGLPIHMPEREAVVLARAAALAPDPLDAGMAERVFAAIVAETRALQYRQGP